MIRAKLFSETATDSAGGTRWRVSPSPFLLSADHVRFFESLGTHLLAFNLALNRLYFESVHGTQPSWIAAYLDQGKPDSLIAYSRLDRFRDLLPDVIRPDVIPTDTGMVITELDSVPGGIGLTACMARAYSEWQMAYSKAADKNSETPAISHKLSAISSEHFEVVGGPDGMLLGFAALLRERMEGRTGGVAIVVSEEARDYRPEMEWMAARLREQDLAVFCVEPDEVDFTEDGLRLARDHRPIALLYRFFELFDLTNVPKSELIMYAAKQGRVAVTPPFKPQLEEKLAFALFHHPALTTFWQKELGEDTCTVLAGVIPKTWILDPRPLPPAAVIPGLQLGGRAIADWRDLGHATQKGRRYVIKPSGFSPLAWGSRGVSVGHDLPQSEWAAVIDQALASFPTTPHILQEFHKGRQFELSYYNEAVQDVVPMAGRARLSPYYFVAEGKAELAGILATVCPPDKKMIHGMKDAIMAPCAVAQGQSESHKV
ncbi:MAG: hypothetical protein A3A88_01825 [Nitrospirae bacterium RIFCSPLOWO2_01_FULL_62_17]|nr:MAG: hypothetical protein A3A88_01825 [Nitrospirae bacterium RIFCSPLOWO2_01_FULL_62_17]